MSAASKAIAAARALSAEVGKLAFGPPVTHVYNPLAYAWAAHRAYLCRINGAGVRVLLLGMNPGPWGMAQTGVPFGEVAAVAEWLGIREPIGRPEAEHPKRPIEGLGCTRSEVSGRRLWGLFRDRFGTADAFFAEHFVANYCPLVFMTESGKNFTPDNLPAAERRALDAACDRHLAALLNATQPEHAVGVGRYAEKCLKRVAPEGVLVTSILHPSPASPAANRGWAQQAADQLAASGVW
ncbi:MAG: uracil-DNA glycosylase family protein [Planctomycetota bacterium]